MKRSNLKLVPVFLLMTVMVFAVVFSCKKSDVAPDPNLNIKVERKLVVSALNSSTNDSIGQFSVSITTPTSTINQVAAGNTYVVTDLVAGAYTIVVSKTGYSTSTAQTVTVALPTDAKTSMILKQTLTLTKAAAAVAVTAAAGAVIPVKANPDVSTSATVADVTVAAGTVFTLADGTKPTTVNISVSNVPVNTQLAPLLNVGGVNEVQVTNIVVIKDQIPVKTLDLQPEGMTFDKPMIIDMYIGDMYPSTMPLDVKIAKQNGLTLNYVKKDGTVEVLTPDHFSTDRNTVYYKVTHFSKWNLLDNWLSIKLISTTKSAVQTKFGACGAALSGTFQYTARYKINDSADPYGAWLLTSRWADAVYTVSDNYSFAAQPNYEIKATWQCTLENWQLTDTCPGFWQQWHTRNFIIPQQGEATKCEYVACHNQGGGN